MKDGTKIRDCFRFVATGGILIRQNIPPSHQASQTAIHKTFQENHNILKHKNIMKWHDPRNDQTRGGLKCNPYKKEQVRRRQQR